MAVSDGGRPVKASNIKALFNDLPFLESIRTKLGLVNTTELGNELEAKGYIDETELEAKGYINEAELESELEAKGYIDETELNTKGYVSKSELPTLQAGGPIYSPLAEKFILDWSKFATVYPNTVEGVPCRLIYREIVVRGDSFYFPITRTESNTHVSVRICRLGIDGIAEYSNEVRLFDGCSPYTTITISGCAQLRRSQDDNLLSWEIAGTMRVGASTAVVVLKRFSLSDDLVLSTNQVIQYQHGCTFNSAGEQIQNLSPVRFDGSVIVIPYWVNVNWCWSNRFSEDGVCVGSDSAQCSTWNSVWPIIDDNKNIEYLYDKHSTNNYSYGVRLAAPNYAPANFAINSSENDDIRKTRWPCGDERIVFDGCDNTVKTRVIKDSESSDTEFMDITFIPDYIGVSPMPSQGKNFSTTAPVGRIKYMGNFDRSYWLVLDLRDYYLFGASFIVTEPWGSSSGIVLNSHGSQTILYDKTKHIGYLKVDTWKLMPAQMRAKTIIKNNSVYICGNTSECDYYGTATGNMALVRIDL